MGNEALKAPLNDFGSNAENPMNNAVGGASIGARSVSRPGTASNSIGSGASVSGKFEGSDGTLVRVTSLDSSGNSGTNGSSGVGLAELSIANGHSINLWTVSVCIFSIVTLS